MKNHLSSISKSFRVVLLLLGLLLFVPKTEAQVLVPFTEDFGGNSVADSGYLTTDPFVGRYRFGNFTYNAPEVNDNNFVITKNAKLNTDWLSDYGDHTHIGDNELGYFVFGFQRSDSAAEFFSVDIPVIPEVGGDFEFSMWLTSLYGQFSVMMSVDGISGNIASKTIESSASWDNEWKNYSLVFNVPATYPGNSVTISLTIEAGEYRFGLDDISVTNFTPSVTVTSPGSGTNICEDWKWTVFSADYNVVYDSSIYKLQYSTNEIDGWTDVGDGGEGDQSSGSSSTSSGTLQASLSFNNPGYYRILVAEVTDTGYSNPVISQNILLTKNFADSNSINIAQSGGVHLGDEITLTASTTVTTFPVFKWYSNESGGNPITEESEYTTTLTPAVPTSGDVPFYYYVTLQYDNLCESPRKKVTITVNNNKNTEDFGGCGSGRDFIYSADNLYDIPGFDYSNNASDSSQIPNVSESRFIITKTTWQDYWEDGNIGFKSITDHTPGCNGYFLEVHASRATGATQFYKSTIEVCGGSVMAFSAWIANISRYDGTARDLDFNFTVSYDVGETSVQSTGLISNTSDAEWKQYSFKFTVPFGASTAIFTITPATIEPWEWGYAFALDDIEIQQLNPVQITAPENSGINILTDARATLEGYYACGELTEPISYQWEKSPDGISWQAVANGDQTTYTTENITDVTYYRLSVTGGGAKLYSDSVKITPVPWGSKTYQVCPDNMSDAEAAGNGYLPSLIRMEVPEAYGIIYEWYQQATDGTTTPLDDDHDDYQSGQTAQEPIVYISDGKTNTRSVPNERNTNGRFVNRTYKVEAIYEAINQPVYPDAATINLRQAYICGATNPVVSPDSASVIHRETFGGTSDTDPDPGTQPIEGMTFDHQTVYNESNPGVQQGYYVVTKKTLGQSSEFGDGWYRMEDHTYGDEKHGYLIAIDGNATPGQFYTHTVNELGECKDIELVFSGWLASPLTWWGTDKANIKFVITDNETGTVLSEFITGNLLDSDGGPDGTGQWRQYGFTFPVPSGVESVTMTLISNSFGTAGGNDMLIDDIGIYLNIVPGSITLPANDTSVCENSLLTLEANYYDESETFGNNLKYRWIYSETNDEDISNWTVLVSDTFQFDQNESNIELMTLKTTYTIPDFKKENEGYYKLVVTKNSDDFSLDGGICLSISLPRRITFDELPEAVISEDATICAGESVLLTITLDLGNPSPWSVIVESSEDGENWNTENPVDDEGGDENQKTITVSPQLTRTYRIKEVTDGNGCTNRYINE